MPTHAFHRRQSTSRRQRGGMISLLLTLLAIGLLAYFALRGFGGHGAQGTAQGGSQAAAVNCERAATALIQQTGGIGPAYQEGYAKLAPACQRMLPPPAALAPPPDPDK